MWDYTHIFPQKYPNSQNNVGPIFWGAYENNRVNYSPFTKIVIIYSPHNTKIYLKLLYSTEYLN